MTQNFKNLPVITLGSPYGIGYQIFLESLKHPIFKTNYPVCIGSKRILDFFINLIKMKVKYHSLDSKDINNLNEINRKANVFILINIDDSNDKIKSLKDITPEIDGDIAYKSIILSAQLVKDGIFKSVATLPVSKKTINIYDKSFTGHTEFYQKYWNEKQVFMTFVSDKLNIIQLTTHVPLSKAIKLIKKDLLLRGFNIAVDFKKKLNLKKDICYLGINPHAGENGLLGKEEVWIKKIIDNFNKNSTEKIIGPVPSDTAFTKFSINKYSIFIANYHDQGLIPFKIFSFEDGVNLSFGMKYIRTSVDHGTGVDLIGSKNINLKSFLNAYKLAVKL
jgi:4-hydroxythreonine-4-phosphate dehydrogenase